MRATSSLLMESPSEGVEVVRVDAQTRVEGKSSIEPCKPLVKDMVLAGVTGCNM